MYFLYIDESGSNTSHFVLAGIAIPATTWHQKSTSISAIKARYNLTGYELHCGPMVRFYIEQSKIPNFQNLSFNDRRRLVINERQSDLMRLHAIGDRRKIRNKKKYFKQTFNYIHLTHAERIRCLEEIADLMGTWTDSRFFAEAVDKRNYNLQHPIYENSFSNVVSRFDTFLDHFGNASGQSLNGLIIQDRTDQYAIPLVNLMKRFHRSGTTWIPTTHIIETPLFVDSQLTSMVQIADICAYATRRFFERNELNLFDRFYSRFDRLRNGTVVGIRHYTGAFNCTCRVCCDHSCQRTIFP